MTPAPSGYAHNGATRLAYDDLGGAGGEPLLLIMGSAVTRLWWPSGFVEELIGRGFHVVAFDNRDSGQSTRFGVKRAGRPASPFHRAPPAYTAEDLTDDVVAVMDALGWESAHLFGHSLGGLIAQRAAMRHRERVRSITTSAAVPSDASRLKLILRYVRIASVIRMARLRFPETPEGDLALSLAVCRFNASPGYPFDEVEARSRVGGDEECPVRDLAAHNRQVSAAWSGDRLASLRVPATILHGECDQMVRATAARDLAKAVAGARLVTFPGVGHDMPRQLWPAYSDEVRAVANAASAV